MDPVVHFEMPFDDQQRVVKFYKSAFGWGMQALGEESGNYVLARTAKSDDQGTPTEPARINGGFFPKKPDWPAQFPNVVIAVDDIHAAMTRVKQAGGEVLGDPMEIPGIGQYVSFFDTERNRVALLQPLPRPAAAKAAGGTRRGARSGAKKTRAGAAKKKTRAAAKKTRVGASKKKKARSRR